MVFRSFFEFTCVYVSLLVICYEIYGKVLDFIVDLLGAIEVEIG